MTLPSEQKNNPLGYAPILPLICKFAIPSILSMLVTAAYNITDQIFIGQKIGLTGNAATNVVFPLTMLITALSLLTGIGTASNFNISLGAKKEQDAREFVGSGLLMMGIVGICLFLLVFFLETPILLLCGATETVLPAAKAYLSVIAFGIPLLLFTTAGSVVIRADGSPRYSMLCIVSGALLNVFLDWLFLFVFDWGMAGAALATVISQIIAMMIGFAINVRFNHDVRIHVRGFRPDGKIIAEIVRIGLPAAVQQSLLSVLTVGLNRILMPFSQTAVSFYGVYYKLQNFLFMPVYGLNNALIPMIGYNFGAKNRRRIERITRYALLLALGIMAAGTVLFELLPVPLLRLFDASDAMLAIGVPAIRIISASFCFAGISVILCGCMQGLGRGSESLWVALLRQLIVILPAAVLLSRISLTAVWFAFLLAEAAGLAAAVALHHQVRRRLLDKLS